MYLLPFFRYLSRFNDVLNEEIEKEESTKTLKRHLSTSTFQDYKTKFLIEKEKQEFEAGGLGKHYSISEIPLIQNLRVIFLMYHLFCVPNNIWNL